MKDCQNLCHSFGFSAFVTEKLNSHPSTYIILHIWCFPLTQYTKPSAQIHMYNAEDFFKFLNSHDQEIRLDHLFEIQMQSALEEAQKPESEPNERTITVSKLTNGFWLAEAGIKVSEDWTVSNN